MGILDVPGVTRRQADTLYSAKGAVINTTVSTPTWTMPVQDGDVTITLTRSISLLLPAPRPGDGIILTVKQDGVVGGADGGSRTMTWPLTMVEFPNQGGAPILVASPGLFNRFGLRGMPGFSKWQVYVLT